MERLCLAKNY